MATELTAKRLAELRERDRMLQEFASDFRLDGDQLVCVHCERRCVGAREDEDFVHAPDCAARTVGGRPWVRLCTLLLMPIDLPALLRAAGERNELRARLRRDCKGCPGCGSNDCPDALDAAQHERDRLRAENETLRKRAVECMPMLETLREALGTDLGSGGGFVSVLDGIDRLRAQRDALVAVLEQCDVLLRVHAKPDNELKTAVQAAIRAAKESQ